jgi:UDP-N-acetylmuramate dehydrogenase
MLIKKNQILNNTLNLKSFAEFYAEIKTKKDLKEVFKFVKQKKIKLRIIGEGSNLLLNQKISGLVLKLNNLNFEITKDFIVLGSGLNLNTSLNTLLKNKYDVAFLGGFPSSIGGLVRGNAGTKKGSLLDYLKTAEIFDLKTGEFEIWSKKDFKATYRNTLLKENPNKIFWQGNFVLPKNPETKENELTEIIKTRLKTQTFKNSAGCFFKNPKNNSAGKLIDDCNLKGLKIGGAYVSEKHCNFLLNDGTASFTDFIELIKQIKKIVFLKNKLNLDLEIEIWDK